MRTDRCGTHHWWTTWARVAAAAAIVATCLAVQVGPAHASTYFPITGEGSSWSANAIQQWIGDVQQVGLQVNYTPNGSTTGRQDWLKGLTDFAASDIPFQSNPQDGSAPEDPASGTYAYMPITSGGTAFMYHLTIAGHRVTNLRLSGRNLASIFTGAIKSWNDPAIQADNPQLVLPATPIVPVVRSDGSGSTFTLSQWMIAQYPSMWTSLCTKSGRPASECGATSFYPTLPGMVAQSGDYGVASYVAASYANGAIGYVNYSYALQEGFPVVYMLNAAGYYTAPSPTNVAVSLLSAKVDTTDVNNPSLYLTQQLGGVYHDSDPRTYPLSMYSYLILPTKTTSSFTTAKGNSLGFFAYYAMCQGQQEAMSPTLGYSPLPVNLVEDAFTQIRKVPGAAVRNINIQQCNNPTFTSNGANRLAQIAPMPPSCAKQGPVQCFYGPGGVLMSVSVTSSNPSGGTSGGTPTTAAGRATGSSSSGGAASAGGRSVATAAGSVASAAGTGSSSTGGSQSQCAGLPGTCSSTAAGGDSSGLPLPQAVAATVPTSHGWGSTQTLMVLVALLAIGVVLAPGLASRYLRGKDS